MTKLEYTFTNDTLFKMIFVKYPDLLKRLVSELLGIRLESIREFVITNTPLTDRQVLHYFELPKLPEIVNADDELKLWLALFKARTEEDLAKIEALEVYGLPGIRNFRHTAWLVRVFLRIINYNRMRNFFLKKLLQKKQLLSNIGNSHAVRSYA